MKKKNTTLRRFFLLRKVLLLMLMGGSSSVFSQIINYEGKQWEESSGSRNASKCKDETLLNFHCGIKDKLLKKYIKHSRNKSYSLTVVHASKEDEAIWINPDKNISLENTKFKRTNSDDKLEIKKRPSIFSYTDTGSSAQKSKGDSLKIKFEDQSMYELIFIPKRLKSLELNKIHSYLSIKYGISLEKGKYYNTEGKVIWDGEKHKDFTYRLTGLGRDDGNKLYQKQSSNQADKILTIGKDDIKRTNNDNTAVLDNMNFALWSDDNKDLTLKHDGNFEVLQRNWEINFIGSTMPKNCYKISIDKSLINPKSLPMVYWIFLKKPDGEIAKIQGTENDQLITFGKVDFNKESESSHFTFAVSSLKDERGESAESIKDKDVSLNPGDIVLYPNPVKSGQTFTVRFPPMENLEVSVYDSSGRLVKMDKVDSKSNHYTNQLYIQSLYLINLTQNGKLIKTFKLIVD